MNSGRCKPNPQPVPQAVSPTAQPVPQAVSPTAPQARVAPVVAPAQPLGDLNYSKGETYITKFHSRSVTYMPSGRFDVFTVRNDSALWNRARVNNKWQQWKSLGGVCTSHESATSAEEGKIYAFCRGTDDALWMMSFYNGNWQGWTRVGGKLDNLIGAGAVALPGGKIFVASLVNYQLQYNIFNGTWQGWVKLNVPGNLQKTPGVVSPSPGVVDVFGLSNPGSYARHIRREANGTWGTWENLDEYSTFSPAVVSLAPETIDVFISGINNDIMRRTFNGKTWLPWKSLGGFTSRIAAVSLGFGRVGVFAFQLTLRKDVCIIFQNNTWGEWTQ